MLEQYGDVLTVSELARALRIGRNRAYELIHSGQIRSVRIGSAIRVPKSGVEAFLNPASSVDLRRGKS